MHSTGSIGGKGLPARLKSRDANQKGVGALGAETIPNGGIGNRRNRPTSAQISSFGMQ